MMNIADLDLDFLALAEDDEDFGDDVSGDEEDEVDLEELGADDDEEEEEEEM